MKVPLVCAFILATLALTFTGKVMGETERYIIMLKEGATDVHIEEVIQTVEGHEGLPREELFVKSFSKLLPMFYGTMSKETADKISELEIVKFVEKDQVVSIDRNIRDSRINSIDDVKVSDYYIDTTRYNLDILDNKNCTDGRYEPFNYGLGAYIYILDTGINYDHEDFKWGDGYPGTRALYGEYDAVDANTGSQERGRDCNGHGTHCAGIAGGLESGVAKDAYLTSIRVMDCNGKGQWSWIIEGIDAAYERHLYWKQSNYFVGSIISMSIGGSKSGSVDNVVNAVVKNGMLVVTSSGNGNTDACSRSPGSAGLNINVGAHGYDKNSCTKPRAYFSNYGTCVDIMAPGVDILSASHTSNTGYSQNSGTSMACPHVAGLAALMLRADKYFTPSQIKDRIKANGLDDIDRSAMPSQDRAISKAKRMYLTPALIA